MKICIISSDFSPEPLGGRSISLKRIMTGIIRKYPKTEFHVITKKSPKGFERNGNMFCYKLKEFGNANKLVIEIDKKINFDIIHGFDIYPDGYIAVSASSTLKKPCIVGIRGVYILKTIDIICRLVAKKADYIVSVDKRNADLFRKIMGRNRRIITIGNSVPIRSIRKKRRDDKSFTIGNVSYLGDMRKNKGWEYLLAAFERIKKDIPNSKLVLIGSGHTDLKCGIKGVIKEKGLEGAVQLRGMIEHGEVLEEMQGFDVYVFSSTFEGMSNAVLEAMSLKKPVVATDVSGIPEIIKDGYNGLLIKPFSSDDIYEKVVSLYRNKKERERLGINAYNTVIKKFNPEREIESWYGLYRKLCQRQ